MERKIIKTADGSVTIHLPEWDEQYHSKHGAIQEAKHVFIKMGLTWYREKYHPEEISILEVGFGTGLNAFITLLEAENFGMRIKYTGVEAYPVNIEEIKDLNYVDALSAEDKYSIFNKLHSTSWETETKITDDFSLCKQQKKFQKIIENAQYNLIYFDAFGARVQPELWTEEVFEIMFKALKTEGVLVTYSAKGSVRRAMQTVGFVVERLPGPPGKREMLRAVKK